MAVLSALRPLNRLHLIPRITKTIGQNVRRETNFTEPFIPGQFPMKPTYYQWNKFKDFAHFYTLLGVIPLTIITTIVNIVVGPAELAEIPEGYEPKHWEYYKNPVTRFFARYCIRDKRIDYEGLISSMNEDSERIIMKRVEQMVRNFMKYKSDYKSWYYRPVDGYILRYEREEWKYMRDVITGVKDYVADENLFSDGGNPTEK